MDHLKTVIEDLFKFDRQLLGAGYDNGLKYLDHLIGLDILEFPTGVEVGTWTVPEEWTAREAWVKFKGEKIIDFSEEPLSLVVYSLPFKGTVSKEDLLKHFHFDSEAPMTTPYTFKFYDRDWGFSVPKAFIKRKTDEGLEDALEEGDYEVFIDTEFKPGVMKIGVHTIKGKSDREILLFAHLDHAYQANDNLSGVACLLDIKSKIKSDHTIKLVFCPETIGSQAYVSTQDLSKVDFVVAVDICGNANPILFQKAWNEEARVNRAFHCALQLNAKTYRKGPFRTCIGSDETPFNDPALGIPGVLLSTWPYPEYHTNEDTPEKINYEKIVETSGLIRKAIEIYEKDYIPERLFKGPLMRSKYGMQNPSKVVNLNLDYLVYMVDGKKTLVELCADLELNFETIYEAFKKIIDGKKMRRVAIGQKSKRKTAKQK